MRVNKEHREIERVLRKAGVNYRIETGTRHRKLYVNDRMVLVFSNGTKLRQNDDRLRAIIEEAKKC